MNTPNNKRKKESIRRIEKVFIDLLQTKKLNGIRVSDICKEAKINRTTFYANYTDIYGLADTIRDRLESNLSDLYKSEITQVRTYYINGNTSSGTDECRGRFVERKDTADRLRNL